MEKKLEGNSVSSEEGRKLMEWSKWNWMMVWIKIQERIWEVENSQYGTEQNA